MTIRVSPLHPSGSCDFYGFRNHLWFGVRHIPRPLAMSDSSSLMTNDSEAGFVGFHGAFMGLSLDSMDLQTVFLKLMDFDCTHWSLVFTLKNHGRAMV